MDLLENDPRCLQDSEEDMLAEMERMKNAKSIDENDDLFKDSLKICGITTKEHPIKYINGGRCEFRREKDSKDFEITTHHETIKIPREVMAFIISLVNEAETSQYTENIVKW